MDEHDRRAAVNATADSGRRLAKRFMKKAREAAEETGLDVDALERTSRQRTSEWKDAALRKTATAAASEQGKTVASASEAAARRLAGLPGLTIGRDLVQARYDLSGHVERLRANPDSIDHLIWTATALRQVEIGLGRYKKVRAVNAGVNLAAGNPTSAIVQLSAGLTSQMLTSEGPPPLEALLRSAFAMAVGRLRSDPADAEAHYAMARAYLLTDDLRPAALSARAAVRTSSNPTVRGDAFTALAFAKLGAGHREEARRAATMAVEAGVSTGGLILANLLETGEDAAIAERRSAAAAHRRSVVPTDEIRYFGPRPKTSHVARSVWERQKEKSRTTATELRNALSDEAGSADQEGR